MNWQRWQLVAAPEEEPIGPLDVLDQAKIGSTEMDAEMGYIQGLVTAAREYAESLTDRLFITQEWDVYLDAFPGLLVFTRGPIQTVDEVAYTPNGGSEVTVDDAIYVADVASPTRRPRLAVAVDQSWPDVTLPTVNGVRVRVTAGYGDASDVPSHAKQMIRLLVAHWYRHREPVLVGQMPQQLPDAVRALRRQVQLA